MNVAETIRFLRENELTFCRAPGKLEVLHEAVRVVEAARIPGIIYEAGVAMGGSAIIIAKTKARERELRLYDVFGMLPPPAENDEPRAHAVYRQLRSGEAGGELARNYLDHVGDLLTFARENMRRAGVDPEAENIRFVKGLYQDTLVIDEPVAFAHIDCDWYDSVKLCIDRTAGRVSLGGVMLFDDYNSFQGCRKAVDEWLPRDARFRVIHSEGTLAVERVRAGWAHP
jgi:O-methyltransferase